jgi:hypothetical protein
LSPTRLFACMSCGQHFELSRIVADSSLNMTLCPECGGHEIQTLGEGTRATVAEPAHAAATEPASQAAPAQTVATKPATTESAAGEDAA